MAIFGLQWRLYSDTTKSKLVTFRCDAVVRSNCTNLRSNGILCAGVEALTLFKWYDMNHASLVHYLPILHAEVANAIFLRSHKRSFVCVCVFLATAQCTHFLSKRRSPENLTVNWILYAHYDFRARIFATRLFAPRMSMNMNIYRLLLHLKNHFVKWHFIGCDGEISSKPNGLSANSVLFTNDF